MNRPGNGDLSSARKCLVTGASGFVGSHLVSALSARGVEVVAACRPSSAAKLRKKRPNLHVLARDLSSLSPADFSGCDTFVHLAARMPDPETTFSEYYDVNVRQARHVFHCAAEAGVARCVQIGSCFEFGASGDTCAQLSAQSPLEPLGGYAVSKAMASIVLRDWAAKQTCCFSLLRLFHIFGPGEGPNRFWPSLRRAARAGTDLPMSGGEQVRDFTPVAYAVARILHECMRPDLVPGIPAVRQIGTGRPQTLRRFAEYWWQHWRAPGRLLFGQLPYREGEAMRYVPEVEELSPAKLCPWSALA